MFFFYFQSFKVVSVIYLGVFVSTLGFFMSASRLLNCFVVVENFSLLLVMCAGVCGNFMLYMVFVVLFTLEAVLALVVLFRVWDSSTLSDVVGF